nr:serine/threonine-protein kinase ppk30 [Quercus suber]
MASAHASSAATPAMNNSHRNATASQGSTRSTQPPGTFLPSTKVQVGNQKVVIDRYLSEGGFAHVYVVRVPRDNGKHELAVLKRVAVPDKEHLANMRTEVETMKKLKGHKHVVTYMDSHASQLHGGGYEVFLLMEFCRGGGLIDFMNTRLQHRLTEPEILKIFGDVAEGLACMHYLKPPLLHRDLKVENVLIGEGTNGTPIYKLCDFGSTAPPRPAATTAEEGRLIEEDVQKHTTMQYRSPEMIDVWRKQPIDEKADIWALGVFLYKLCYYTTPFEDLGQMAILNASYKFPTYPSFSERLKRFVATMLQEDPKLRPTIYQVIREVCGMRGVDVPIKDIYADRTPSDAREHASLSSTASSRGEVMVGITKAAPQIQVQSLPDIVPGRRGRPTSSTQQGPVSKANPSPIRGDPFAALDAKNYDTRAGAVEELSKRFPSLDEFSIANDKNGKFPFQTSAEPQSRNDVTRGELNNHVTAALADEVFAQVKPKKHIVQPVQAQLQHATTSQPSYSPPTRPARSESASLEKPQPLRSGQVRYVSTGVGSSPPPSLHPQPKLPSVSTTPIWRIPNKDRSTSQPRPSAAAQAEASALQPSLTPLQRPALHEIHRSKSQTSTSLLDAQQSTSSRPSLEIRRPSSLGVDNARIDRAKSVQSGSRPSSLYVSSNMEFLRDQENTRKRPSTEIRRASRHNTGEKEPAAADIKIDNDLEFLRNSEDTSLERRKSDKKSQDNSHHKRSSLGSMAGAKQMLAGRLGDAFKRFDPSKDSKQVKDLALVTPNAHFDDNEPRLLSPIAGSVYSEAAPSRHSDMDSTVDETEDLPADVRRELERRRLSIEERRVANAAAEYRARVTTHGSGGGPTNKATDIQKRVQSLLEEGRQSPVKRTAEGYGRHTDLVKQSELPVPSLQRMETPPIAQKPNLPFASNNPYPKTRPQQTPTAERSLRDSAVSTLPASPALSHTMPRSAPGRSGPSIPPKSSSLRTGGKWPPPKQQPDHDKASPARPTGSSGLAALLAKDLQGVPEYPSRSSDSGSATMDSSANANSSNGYYEDTDTMEMDFSKRYPSLAGIEMVETEITGPASPSRDISGSVEGRAPMREV